MKQLGKRFLEEYVRNHCKPSTAYEYGRSVKLFIDPRIPDHHRGGLLCLSRRTARARQGRRPATVHEIEHALHGRNP